MNEGRCVKCGSCLRACPVLNDPSGTQFPGPRTVGVDAPRFLEKGSVGQNALRCTMCHACEWACPSGMTLTRSMLQLRSELSGDLLPGHRRMVGNVASFGRTVATEFNGWREEGERVLYFPGCIGLGRLTGLTESVSSLLTSLGIAHDISREALCCGSPLLKIGVTELAEDLRRRNAEVFSRYDRIITSCPGCTYQLREVYGVEAEHIIEVLRGSDLRSNLEGRWALQVPCHLKRGLSPWTADDLAAILGKAGVDVVRMPEEDSCCGGGGGMLSGFPETSGSLARGKVEIYRRAGVEGVITACPFCSLNLGREGARVLDIGEAITLKH
ncbi:MAG TPA: heterodisulfide reductase-related iron-sulfur binding cluster [Methanomassiliicoccales archaeon]|nr:heterodisulfide reductase-related iron-sulfur binding cluster [Methanomassiliicoccales archaeon]